MVGLGGFSTARSTEEKGRKKNECDMVGLGGFDLRFSLRYTGCLAKQLNVETH